MYLYMLLFVNFCHSYPAYVARCQLAAIDYMKHKDRGKKKDKAGNNWYSKISYPLKCLKVFMVIFKNLINI